MHLNLQNNVVNSFEFKSFAQFEYPSNFDLINKDRICITFRFMKIITFLAINV